MVEEHKEEHGEHHHHPAPGMSGVHKLLVVLAVVQIALLLFVAFKVVKVTTGGTIAAAEVNAPSAAAPSAGNAPSANMQTLADEDAFLGAENAPVTLVEFSDYQCPFCERFYSDAEKQIREQYVKTGKVKFIYRDFPLSFHENAQKAAEAAECAGEQGKYWEMHDKLFESGVSGGVAGFKQYAQQLRLDTGKFNTCLDSGQMAPEVQKDFSDGQRAGIQGTPGFIINGQLVSGAQPFSVFQQVIDAALAAN